MNKARRAVIREASDLISRAVSELERARDAEQDAFDNLPEQLQESDRYADMESNASLLDDAVSALEDVLSDLSPLYP